MYFLGPRSETNIVNWRISAPTHTNFQQSPESSTDDTVSLATLNRFSSLYSRPRTHSLSARHWSEMRLKSLLEALGTESWEWCYEMNRANGQFDEKSMTGAHWSGMKLESSFICQTPSPQALFPIRVTGVLRVQSNKCKKKKQVPILFLEVAYPFRFWPNIFYLRHLYFYFVFSSFVFCCRRSASRIPGPATWRIIRQQ